MAYVDIWSRQLDILGWNSTASDYHGCRWKSVNNHGI